jgi:cytochrome c peroxidase
MRAAPYQPFKMGLAFLCLVIALAAILAPSPAVAQQPTQFGSASGVRCPGGNVICNGSINFLTTELFFEPETPAISLKDGASTWNEIEYLLDNPYVTGGGGNVAVVGAACRDGNGNYPRNDQGYPTYCTPTAATNEFAAYVRRPAFGVTHAVAATMNGAQGTVAGLPPLRIHGLNYNAPNGTQQRVLNPNYGGGSFNQTDVCYTLGASCTPPTKMITVSAGAGRLNPAETEIDYDVAFGRKLPFCQVNPEPVPLDAPFHTAFDSESLTACGSDAGEPGAASLAHNTTGNALLDAASCATELLGAGSLAVFTCEDNIGLPFANQATTGWYSTPSVPDGNVAVAALRQIPPTASTSVPTTLTGTGLPIQPGEWLVDPGTRGRILPYNPATGTGGLNKPSLRIAAVGGNGITPNYVYNSEANLLARGADTIQFSNENDYIGLYTGNGATGNYYSRKKAARLEAARLGKALFWDMQVGSDGVQACGSCHAHAGADNRTKNQINPFGADGISGNPTNFDTSGALTSFTFPPNYDLTAGDFPFHKLQAGSGDPIADLARGVGPDVAGDPVCRNPISGNVAGISFPDGDPPSHPLPNGGIFVACNAGNIVSDTDDVASSMGVHFGRFLDIPPIGAASFGPASNGVQALVRDLRSPLPADNIDPIAGFAGVANADGSANQFRRVEPRNTPTIFLAQANFDNFWDGRARHDDNGGSVFGPADPQAHVFVDQGTGLIATRQLIKFSSIASLAKGPALSKFEMSFDGRNWAKIGKKLLQAGVTPLANQLVDPTDSILGPYSNQGGSACGALPAADRSGAPSGTGVPGLCISYAGLIRHAFYPALWQNTASHLNGCYTDARADIHPNQCAGTAAIPILDNPFTAPTLNTTNTADPFDGYVLTLAGGAASPTDTNQFTQMEANFSLFWGQSINAWASLLVPDDTPFDQFMDRNPDAGMAMGESGEPLLVLDMPNCSNVPAGYVRDSLHPGCFREVGNFKRDNNLTDTTTGVTLPAQNAAGDFIGGACVNEIAVAGVRECTQRVSAAGTRVPHSNTPDPLLGMDLFFGSNVSLKNPEFRSARCGACHNAPNLTDNTTVFTHKVQLSPAFPEFERGNPAFEPLLEPLRNIQLISAFHLEDEINGPGQDATERKTPNESIVPAPVVTNNGNCITDNCSGYAFPDAITLNADGLTYTIHSDLGTGPVAGLAPPVPFTGFGGAFLDNGVYNIGVRPCVADQSHVTGACEDLGRGQTDAFGWPLSLAALLMKNLGGPQQQPGTALRTFNPSANAACAPYCATGGLWENTGHDQQINPGQGDEQLNPLLPDYLAPAASRITVGDAHPQLDEACGPVGGCVNTLTDVANAEGLPEIPFDPRAHMSEVINNAVAPGNAMLGGPGFAEQGTWPVVNRVNRFGAFKAPQLREVELTGPYFHNGGKLTLRQVVDFYVRGGDFPVTNSAHRDFNIENLNAELQSNLSEEEKVALVDFMLELTDRRVAIEAAPFDHPQMILPLDGTAPESDGTVNRDVMLGGTCSPSPLGPGATQCTSSVATQPVGATGPLFVNIPATGAAGIPGAVSEPNFLGITGVLGRQRLVGAAAKCTTITSQYCH